ncbi:hypothetical protein FJT64_020914 [Amphibalanus amphitrite]|uniref:Uncharacterized protein n=1 Tax=Amphibalanus amphitrite TaxID=1232801 RepID=A0A6A4WVQ2_AMPAM|nr:hypothetical protein FJT64_020914 [Amphibalanus amphitrite]
MQHMLGNSRDDTGLLRTLFLQRLPQTTRAALALLPESTGIDDLASAADRFQEASQGAVVAAAVAPPASHSCNCQQSAGTDLTAAVAALTATVARMEASYKSLRADARRRSRSRPARRPATPGTGTARADTRQPPATDGLCWYHERFGADAHQCRQPCSWQGN